LRHNKQALERGPRLKRREPTLPQPFKRLALAYKVPVRPLAKPVLVALRLPNNLQDKPET
jgi:hypothetical protein